MVGSCLPASVFRERSSACSRTPSLMTLALRKSMLSGALKVLAGPGRAAAGSGGRVGLVCCANALRATPQSAIERIMSLPRFLPLTVSPPFVSSVPAFSLPNPRPSTFNFQLSTLHGSDIRFRGFQNLSDLRSRIVFQPARRVEYHCCALIDGIRGPIRQSLVIGISGSRHLSPSAGACGFEHAHLGFDRADHAFARVDMIEHERNLDCMGRTKPHYRRLPRKHVEVCRSLAERRAALRQPDGINC